MRRCPIRSVRRRVRRRDVGGRLVERACDTAAWLPPTDCYWLEVPERRDAPEAGTIRLWVTVVQGEGSAAELPPVIDVTGGPGDAASTAWVNGSVVLDGDGRTIVVMDQRGTGRSEPHLDCDFESGPPSTTPWPDRVAARRLQVVACRDRLIADGVDLDGYDTVEGAADFVDLRHALGVDQFLLRGYSYGGRLAREIYRQDPGGVAGLLLDSPLTTSPQGAASLLERGNDALARLDEWCRERPECADLGTPSANLADAAGRLDAEPYEVANGLVVDGGVLYSGVFRAMYRTDLLPVIPSAIASIADGNNAVIDAFAGELLPTFDDPRDAPADGLFEVVTCADDAPSASDADRAALADPGIWEELVLDRVACDLWDVQPGDDSRSDRRRQHPGVRPLRRTRPDHPAALRRRSDRPVPRSRCCRRPQRRPRSRLGNTLHTTAVTRIHRQPEQPTQHRLRHRTRPVTPARSPASEAIREPGFRVSPASRRSADPRPSTQDRPESTPTTDGVNCRWMACYAPRRISKRTTRMIRMTRRTPPPI